MSDVDPQPEPELERWHSEAREVEGVAKRERAQIDS